jgi:RNA polymerase sigma-70 factor (ECF subfamily)
MKRAFHLAVAELEPRERNLLRMHLLDGLSIDQIGVFYRIHRATAFRWVAKARERVWDETRNRLREKLRLSPSEYDSILHQVRSQLDLSIERVLGSDAAD